MLELQEQAVGARRGEASGEGDLAGVGSLLGVQVQVGQVTLAQPDQVAAGPEIGLQVGDRGPVAGHAEAQLDLLAGDRRRGAEGDLVAVGAGRGGRDREGLRLEGAGDEQVGPQRVGTAVDGDVGKGPVDSWVYQGERRGPGAVGSHRGVEVLEPGQVPAHDHQVQGYPALFGVEVRHRLLVGAEDAEREGLLLAGGEDRLIDDEAQVTLGHGQPTGRLTGHAHAVGHAHAGNAVAFGATAGGNAAGVTSPVIHGAARRRAGVHGAYGVPGRDSDAEHESQSGAEDPQASGSVHLSEYPASTMAWRTAPSSTSPATVTRPLGRSTSTDSTPGTSLTSSVTMATQLWQVMPSTS